MTPFVTPRFCEKEFMMVDDAGGLHPVTAWVEDNEGFPSFQFQHKRCRTGITLANYRAKGELDELIVIAREAYKSMRQVCYLPYRHKDMADPAISSWVYQCLEGMKTGKLEIA